MDACPAAFTRFGIVIAEVHDDPNGVHKREDFANALRTIMVSQQLALIVFTSPAARSFGSPSLHMAVMFCLPVY